MERAAKHLDLKPHQAESLCAECFGEGNLTSLQTLSGGAVNSVYKFLWNDQPYVLRFYVRDPKLAEIEASVYHLVQNSVPVPKLLHTAVSNEFGPFAIFEFVNKKHIFEFSHSAEPLSYDLGRTLAKIHNFHFPKAGLIGRDFIIETPFEEGSSPYYDYIQEHLTKASLAWQRLGNRKAEELVAFLNAHQNAFPIIQNGSALVHSDFKPVNLLWDEHDGLTVLDWEFAHIGHPLFDFAILTRHSRDFPLKIASLEEGYHDGGGSLPDDWIQKARITDTVNVVQLLNTPTERPKLFKSLIDSLDLTGL